MVAAVAAICSPVPVVMPANASDMPMPVAKAVAVTSTRVAAVVVFEAKSSRVPVVVPVSAPVDVILKSELPAPRTVVP